MHYTHTRSIGNWTTWSLPATSFNLSVTTDGTSDGKDVCDALLDAEDAKRAKRIKKLTKAHQRAWYANANRWDVAGYWAADDVWEVAVVNQMADGELRWRISGRNGTLSFPEFVKHLVDHKVHPDGVNPLA